MRRPLVLLVPCLAVLALAGCGSDAPGSNLPPGISGAPAITDAPGEPEPPADNSPATVPPEQPSAPVTVAPEQPQPAPETPVEPDPVTPTDDSALPVLLGLVLIVLAVVVLVAVFTRRSKPTDGQRPAPAPTPQVDVLTTAQWIHDHLTLELLAAAPTDALARWNVERSRVDSVAIAAQQQYAQGNGDGWNTLSQTMTALGSSLDTNLRLRAQDPVDPTLLTQSTDVVNRERSALIRSIAALQAPPTV